jgi:hypothetical protein
MGRLVSFGPGLDFLYRTVIAELFRRERRPLLPVQIPAVLGEGFSPEVGDIVDGILPRLEEMNPDQKTTCVLGGEDTTVVAAIARELAGRKYDVTVVNPLIGMARLVSVVNPFSMPSATTGGVL